MREKIKEAGVGLDSRSRGGVEEEREWRRKRIGDLMVEVVRCS